MKGQVQNMTRLFLCSLIPPSPSANSEANGKDVVQTGSRHPVTLGHPKRLNRGVWVLFPQSLASRKHLYF